MTARRDDIYFLNLKERTMTDLYKILLNRYVINLLSIHSLCRVRDELRDGTYKRLTDEDLEGIREDVAFILEHEPPKDTANKEYIEHVLKNNYGSFDSTECLEQAISYLRED